MIGPKKNNIKFACVGDTYSFNINFNASATMLNPTYLYVGQTKSPPTCSLYHIDKIDVKRIVVEDLYIIIFLT